MRTINKARLSYEIVLYTALTKMFAVTKMFDVQRSRTDVVVGRVVVTSPIIIIIIPPFHTLSGNSYDSSVCDKMVGF